MIYMVNMVNMVVVFVNIVNMLVVIVNIVLMVVVNMVRGCLIVRGFLFDTALHLSGVYHF